MDNSPSPSSGETTGSKVVFLAGVTLVSMLSGFGFNAAFAGRRRRAAYKAKLEGGHEDPVLMATRALGWGSLYAVCGVGAIVATIIGISKL